jgi:hypothetical protein
MDAERQKKIAEKLRDDERETLMLTGLIRERVYEFLVMKKGYAEDEIYVDMPVEVTSGGNCEACSVDFVVKVGGIPLVAIKCSPTALESHERHIVAFSRVAGNIPFSVVTNSEYSRVLDASTGRLVSEDLSALPGRAQAVEMIKDMKPSPLPEEKLRKERCILLAFNALRCSVPDICPSEKE